LKWAREGSEGGFVSRRVVVFDDEIDVDIGKRKYQVELLLN
jgi:hypothetical protein